MLKLDIQRFNGQMGYNEGLIHNLISKEQTAYDDIMSALGDKMTEMAVTIAGLWYAGNAVRFFNEFLKPVVDDTANVTTQQFQNIVDTVNSAGQGWAKTTENSYSYVNFAPSSKTVDVSSVREADGNGSSYMTKGATSETFNNRLNEITQAVSSALDAAKTAATTSGFLSSQNEGALQQSLASIANKFNDMMNNIRTEFNTAMNAKEDQYKATETSVNESMSL